MNELRVLRWLGMICLLAGIARIGMTPTAIIWGTDSVPELSFGYAACILMAVGSIAGYLVQSKETGLLGFISVLGITIGNILTTALLFSVFILGASAPEPDGLIMAITGVGSMIGLSGGTLLFAVLTFRAKVLPRWVAGLHVLMLLSAFLPVEDNVYFAFFWGLAYVGMGICIWTGRLTPRSQPEQ
ncbi:hypothetical protein K0T92_12390 [Paenibacillus oenotherae]|uniref:Uncharacterized protein n=1 Tax=Paenibacillus oenotherae TaxID=1435645 RepID=A0ABS7D7P3_9BACL|nr:hypothetical protein [Paenibacillus oenotherae]MBW7475551.1 hypothetical protein [Paenibacillus oenotherae]